MRLSTFQLFSTESLEWEHIQLHSLINRSEIRYNKDIGDYASQSFHLKEDRMILQTAISI